jgi:hypothetical protein
VARIDGEWQLLYGLHDFRRLFAPISSPDEALSYALAVNGGYYTFFGYNYAAVGSPGTFVVKTVENTHVDETAEGYLVHLFTEDMACSCALVHFSSQDVLVRSDGSIQLGTPTVVSQQDICVD